VDSQKFVKTGTIRSMKIVSLNVGLPSAQNYEGREVITGGAKQPVSRAVLRLGNFDGDRQADLLNHGGLEKAVCVYPFDHYPYWSRRLGRDLKPGAFSENLTVCGAIETEVCVGDVFRIGEAMVQVSQPRMPCAKLAGKNGSRMLPKLMTDVGYTGFYMRAHHDSRGEQHHLREVLRRRADRTPSRATGVLGGRPRPVCPKAGAACTWLTTRPPSHDREAYSAKCVEGEFSEVGASLVL
jgi:hypothetical protein